MILLRVRYTHERQLHKKHTHTHKREETSKRNKEKKKEEYSRLPITRTFKGNRKKVKVMGSLKQITGSKKISKWMGRKGN